ncbi:hypothetical protein [Variovorax ginsengisoli]|uniref:Uncharacterized protein n=1 Tax=Variovorax ginsengisoli TaxID=363844 RepID=A0ABT9S7F9_9BURK|nr:hypothetical protein [Variovorax ginsengisoli]MDP9899701.1 hypothetical protein [Variovorax ginsengisoli]
MTFLRWWSEPKKLQGKTLIKVDVHVWSLNRHHGFALRDILLVEQSNLFHVI